MKKRIFTFFVLFIATFFSHDVFAVVEEDITIVINGQEIATDVFDGALGSTYNGAIVLTATDETGEITIRTQISDESMHQNLLDVRFYNSELDAELQKKLDDNNGDIVTFCRRITDETSEWCEGSNEITVKRVADESVRIPMTIHVPDDAKDHSIEFLVSSGDVSGQGVVTKEVMFRVPDKNIAEVILKDLRMERAFGIMDIGAWLASGMKDEYSVRGTIENVGTEDVDCSFVVYVRSLWTDEVMTFEEHYDSKAGETQEKEVSVTMPRFGKVEIVGSVQFDDVNGDEKESRSEAVTVMVWPILLLMGVVGICCFCIICVLLYKYIRKNMFRFKKNKKKKDHYTGSYVVKDTDNIISIAQMYNVPWKELAQRNNIEPPYILISGESITVPGDDDANNGDHKEKEEKEIVQEDPQEKDPDHENDHEETIPSVHKNNMRSDLDPQREPTISTDHDLAMKNSSVNASTLKPQPKKTSVTESMPQSKKRKISYAAPQNMLTRPSSEPTLRAIDIEWMRDDEEIYSEEMEQQQKKTNIRFFAMMGIGGIVIIAAMWFVGGWVLQQYQKDTVSVEELIQLTDTEDSVMVDQDEYANHGNENSDEDQNIEEDNNDGESAPEEVVANIVEPSEITMLVLNGGAQTGAAGTVSQIFTEKGYDVKDPQNAQNAYSDVTVYYATSAKDHAEKIISDISAQYGEQTLEESNDVVQRYDVDIVIVLGA
jgi:LysM repeat protein